MVALPPGAASGPLPKSGPFPPPALPGFRGTMSLSDSLRDRTPPSRVVRWCLEGYHRAGSLVLLGNSPCRVPVTITPAGPGRGIVVRPNPGCGLPLSGRESAPTTYVFGACTVFTVRWSFAVQRGITARELAERLTRPLSPKASYGFVTSTDTSAASG